MRKNGAFRNQSRWDSLIESIALKYQFLNQGWVVWLTTNWWHYLLDDCENWNQFRCRMKGHPHGVVYYNPSGYEPDMSCKDCGDELG